jgi:hypothetical protein
MDSFEKMYSVREASGITGWSNQAINLSGQAQGGLLAGFGAAEKNLPISPNF